MTIMVDPYWKEVTGLSISHDDGVTLTVPWKGTGYAGDFAAREGLLETLPAFVVDPTYGACQLMAPPTVTHVGGDVWEGEAIYRRGLGPSGFDISFQIGGGTEKLNRSLQTTRYPSTAPDFGTIVKDGVDVVVPSLDWTEVHEYPEDSFGWSNIKTYANSIGKRNAGVFRGVFAATEVLIRSIQPSYQPGAGLGSGRWGVAFQFSYSPVQTGLTVAGVTGVNKNGHDYVEVKTRPIDDETNKATVEEVIGVYVHREYDNIDFSLLNLTA